MQNIQQLEAELARLRPIAERTGCLLADYEYVQSELKQAREIADHMSNKHSRVENLAASYRHENEQMRALLEGILNSCVHPDQAVRALFVDVKPIRKFLNGK